MTNNSENNFRATYFHQPTVLLGTNLLCACCCSVLDAVVLLTASCVQVSTFFPLAGCMLQPHRQGLPGQDVPLLGLIFLPVSDNGIANKNYQLDYVANETCAVSAQETVIRGPFPFLSVSPSFSPFLLLSHQAIFSLFCYKPSAMDPVGKSLCICLSIHCATVVLSSSC